MVKYSSWEERPIHPVTGRPADGYWQTESDRVHGRKQPRWKADPANKLGIPLEDRFFTVREVAHVLGDYHPRTIWVWIRDGKLKASRAGSGPGSKWLIRGSDLMAFIGADPKHEAAASVCGVKAE